MAPDDIYTDLLREMTGDLVRVVFTADVAGLTGRPAGHDARGLKLVGAMTHANCRIGTVYIPWSAVAFVYIAPEGGHSAYEE